MSKTLADLADTTERSLWETKLACRPESFWYPYETLANVYKLEQLCAMAGLDLFQVCRGPYHKVADIGAGDGDLAFFLEKSGFSVEIFDNPRTNFNGLEGARVLKEAMKSSVEIRSIDLDSQFELPLQKYDAVFFLGTLYHLKNPFFVLERLARMASYCFFSTRVASHTTDGLSLSSHPLAYLLNPDECNNDDTNFWIFSDQGLKRLIARTGWTLLSYTTFGNTTSSTPSDPDRDERAFCVLRSNVLPWIMARRNLGSDAAKGEITILWNAGAENEGMVYVSKNGGEELLFAAERHDSRTASWIETGSVYDFRLYNSDHTKLLASVTVTGTSQ